MFDQSNSSRCYEGSSSSADDPIELDRIREWMDHHDWDVLDEPAEVRRDKEICIQLLLEHRPVIDSDFLPERSAPGDSVPEISSTEQSPTPLPTQIERTSRFSSPQFLGVGSFGIVFSVRDELLGMDVAIKVLRPSKSRSRELRARFIGEAQVTASLSHPSIVRVYDTGQIGGLPYITSAKMDGGTLADQITKGLRLSIRQAAWIVARISDSVQFAHSKAILHRDLKPSNVLLMPCEPRGSEQVGFQPMLTDFGLAKRLDQEKSTADKTRDGRVLGTVRYMSPEQARGAHSDVGIASDVFSLGIILYQLLLGKVPFDDPLDQNIRTMISEREPTRPRLVDKFVPADLEAVVLKCLAKEPSARYQSAAQLSVDLDRFLRGEPVEAKKSTLVRRWGYAARKHPVISSLMAIALLTNCLTIVGLSISLRNERISKDRERLRVIDLVSVYTQVGDDIFAGKRIKDNVMLDLSLKMRGILVEYLDQNPDDEKVLHLKSVLSHFQSIAYQRTGTAEQYIAARAEVLDILGKLLQSNPENELYRFQQFFSRLILSEWLIVSPEFTPASISLTGIELLESAHADIERLSKNRSDKLHYLDALAATKLTIAKHLSKYDLDKCKRFTSEAVAISEKLWLDHPDRPVFAKHAIGGYAKLAKYALLESENERALTACENGIRLFNSAWKPIEDEAWVISDMCPILDVWIEVHVANGKLEEALKFLDDSDRYLATRRADFPNDLDLQISVLNTGLMRHEVLLQMANEQASRAEWERLIRIGMEFKTQQAFLDSLPTKLESAKRATLIRAVLGN